MLEGKNKNSNKNVQENDYDAIKLLIERFSSGIRELDHKIISSVFHQKSNSFSLTSRGVCFEPYEAWTKIIKSAKSNDAHIFKENFSINIIKIDVIKTIASAKVEWNFENTRIVDLYNLIKEDDDWVIVNQVYHTFS